MGTKKAIKKTAKKSVTKSPRKASKKSANKSATKVVKTGRPGKKAKSVSVVGLQALRDDMQTLTEEPRQLDQNEVRALAGRVHKEIETFLMACGGAGNGQSITKVSIIPSGGN